VVLNCHYPNLKHAISASSDVQKPAYQASMHVQSRTALHRRFCILTMYFSFTGFSVGGYQSELIATCSQTVSACYRRYISDGESSRKFRTVPRNQSLILTTELDEATTHLLSDVRDWCFPIQSYGIRVSPWKRTQLAALNRLPREHLELYVKMSESLSSKTGPFQ
jgi:hypothetical protein